MSESRKIYAIAEPERTTVVRRRTNERVVIVAVTVKGSDAVTLHPGELLGVATSPNGSTSNLAILRDLGGNLRAVSVATIVSIDSPAGHGREDEFEAAGLAGVFDRYR